MVGLPQLLGLPSSWAKYLSRIFLKICFHVNNKSSTQKAHGWPSSAAKAYHLGGQNIFENIFENRRSLLAFS